MGIFYYNGKDKKSQRKFRRFQIFAGFFSVLLIALVFGVFFGNACGTNGREGGLGERKYFAVCMGVYSDYNTAASQAAKVKNRGGAGFIREDKGYRVLSAVYENKADLDSVLKKLEQTGNEATAYVIRMPAVKLPKAVDADLINGYCNLYLDTVRALYRESLALDTYSANEEETRLRLRSLLPTSAYANLGYDLVSIKFRAEFTAASTRINQLALGSQDRYTLAAELRYLQLELLTDLARLRLDIAA